MKATLSLQAEIHHLIYLLANKMRYITYIGILIYLVLISLYSFRDADSIFWRNYYMLTGGYISILGFVLNFRINKSLNEMACILFITFVRVYLFLILALYYTIGDNFLNSSLSFHIWLIIAGSLSLIYKLIKDENI